jgi:uncharacterized protein DUF4168
MMMASIRPWNVVAWALAVVGAAWLAAAPAQTPQSPPDQSSFASSPSDKSPATAQKVALPPSDAELKSFADAVVEVHRINDAYIPKLEAAGTADEEQKLEAAALREMIRAVENEGLSVEKYEQILTQAQTDRELVHRLKSPLRVALSRQWT